MSSGSFIRQFAFAFDLHFFLAYLFFYMLLSPSSDRFLSLVGISFLRSFISHLLFVETNIEPLCGQPILQHLY